MFVTTYAFFDSGSTATFCTMEISSYRAFHFEGGKTALNLTIMGQHRTKSCSNLHDLEVSDLDDEHTIKLPLYFYTKPNLAMSRKDIVTLDDLQNWPYLIVWC